MKWHLAGVVALGWAGAGLAQGPLPDVGAARPQQGPPAVPGSGGNSGGIGGLGGIGFSISLGRKAAKLPAPPELPALQMQDNAIADHVEGRLLFTLALPGSNAARIARAAGVTIIEQVPLDQIGSLMVVARLAPGVSIDAVSAKLRQQRGVEAVQPDYLFQSLAGNSRSKGFALHGIPDADRNPVTGTIAMIDTAVDIAHPDLAGAGITQQIFGIPPAPSPHGTAIAELLVGRGKFPGTAPGAQLISLAAFAPADEKSWLSQTSYLARAMNEALRLRPQVLNLSFGRNGNDPLMARALDKLQQTGVCVVAAAGNGSGAPVLFPATHPASLAVTAVDGRMRAYQYASQGPQISVAAWGVDLSAAVPGGRRSVSGTSFATAVVSGALLRTPECSTARDPAAMKARMMAQAKDLGPKGADPVFGAGLFELLPTKK